MMEKSRKIFCPHCRQESAIKIEKIYDGFTPVGETKTCAFCGHEFVDGEPAVIEEKIPEALKQRGERKVCYRCLHYVVNPFVQKCALHGKEVEALGSCPDFSARPPGGDSPDKDSGKDDGTAPPAIF